MVLGWSSLVMTLLWVSDCQLLVLCSHGRKRVRVFSGVLFIRALIPFLMTLPSWPHHLPKFPVPNTITLGVGISTYGFLGTGHQHSAHTSLYQHYTECSESWHIVENQSRVTNKTGTSQLALAAPLGVSGTVLSSWLLFGMVASTNSLSSYFNRKQGGINCMSIQGEGESSYINIHFKKKKMLWLGNIFDIYKSQ